MALEEVVEVVLEIASRGCDEIEPVLAPFACAFSQAFCLSMSGGLSCPKRSKTAFPF